MKNKNLIYLIIGIVLVILVGGLLVYNVFLKDAQDKGPLTYDTYTVFKGHKGYLSEYDKTLYVEGYNGNYGETYYIEGDLATTNEKEVGFVIITFNLYDKNGRVIGEAYQGINHVVSGTAYHFKAVSTATTEVNKQVVRYDIKSIIGK